MAEDLGVSPITGRPIAKKIVLPPSPKPSQPRPRSGAPSGKPKPTGFGTVGGVFYTGLTQQELEQNKLAPDTQAVADTQRTQQVQRTRRSFRKLQQGTGTAFDLINVQSKGTGRVELFKVVGGRVITDVTKKKSLATVLRNQNEVQRFRTQVTRTLNNKQKQFLNTLQTQKERDNYLVNVASRRTQPKQTISDTPQILSGRRLWFCWIH